MLLVATVLIVATCAPDERTGNATEPVSEETETEPTSGVILAEAITDINVTRGFRDGVGGFGLNTTNVPLDVLIEAEFFVVDVEFFLENDGATGERLHANEDVVVDRGSDSLSSLQPGGSVRWWAETTSSDLDECWARAWVSKAVPAP